MRTKTKTTTTHQGAVEELMHREPQHAERDVGEVQEQLLVVEHPLHAELERAAVTHETHDEDRFVDDLRQEFGWDCYSELPKGEQV